MLKNWELKGNEYLLLSFLVHRQGSSGDRIGTWLLEGEVVNSTSMSRSTYYRCMDALISKGYLDKPNRWEERVYLTKKAKVT